MEDRIVVYQTFDSTINANIIKGLLEAHGVSGFLESENMVTLNPLYSNALGGIRLCIFEKDLERATNIYNSKNLVIDGFEEVDTPPEMKCIYCDSENVSFGLSANDRFGWFSVLLAFLFMVYPFIYKKRFHCFDCGNEFSKKTKIEDREIIYTGEKEK